MEPLRTTFGQLGRGVTADGNSRIRSQFLDAAYRRDNGELGRFPSRQEMLGQVEVIFGEPSDWLSPPASTSCLDAIPLKKP